MPETRLFGGSWLKVIKALLLYETVHVSLFFSWHERLRWWIFIAVQRQELVFDQLEQVNWHRAMPFLIIFLIKFAYISRNVVWIIIWLNRCTENQIFLRNSFFSNADIHLFLYCLIECFQVNRMCITGNWSRKLSNKALNYTCVLCFSKYFTWIYLKGSNFWKVSRELLK